MRFREHLLISESLTHWADVAVRTEAQKAVRAASAGPAARLPGSDATSGTHAVHRRMQSACCVPRAVSTDVVAP